MKERWLKLGGGIRHNAIVVTCGFDDVVEIAWDKANELFDSKVTNIVDGVARGCFSFLIVPDGGKEGWDISNEYDEKRDVYFKWLDEYKLNIPDLNGTISIYVKCVEVYFGGDNEIAGIVRTND